MLWLYCVSRSVLSQWLMKKQVESRHLSAARVGQASM